MKDLEQLSILFLFVITGIWYYAKRKKKRKKLLDLYKSKLDCIKIATGEFANFLDFKTGYFTNYQLSTWKNQQTNIYNELKGKPFEYINLSSDDVKMIKEFNNYFEHSWNLITDYNRTFLIEELEKYNSFFNDIEGRKLDKQQRTAIVTDEDNNIVIAGAGSGKTTTIIGKINYIVERYKINPQEILLISFTNKSALTLSQRIDIEGIDAKTFHKFGMDIIAKSEGRQPSIFDDSQFKPLLTRIFYSLIENENYLKNVTDYFTDFLKPIKSQFEFDNQGDYIQYIKDHNFKPYKLKKVLFKGTTTFKMEVVKSIEECKIANFFLFNGIDYEYEEKYEFCTATETFRQYKPDFTVKQNGKKIYIEHFGVSREGNVPKFFTKKEETLEEAKNRYWEKINWARELHRTNETTLIETYSYEMSEGILFDNLTEHLMSAGIELKPKSPEEIWQIISNTANEEVNSLITLFGTFISLMKSNNYSIDDVVNKNKQTQEMPFEQRNSSFIEIIEPIYKCYEEHLAKIGEIDFSDMINRASQQIVSGMYKHKFSYVIIDEFQDISIGRYQLIKAIRQSNPACKIFAVGDDWQSIYRFSGSDISLFKDFDKYFGFTVKSKIETTYRFQNPLINISSDFILKNPNQVKKELIGASSTRTTNFYIHYSISDKSDDTLAVQNIFNQLLLAGSDIQEKEIYILGRYGFDINRIKNENGVFKIDKENEIISYVKTEEGKTKKLVAQFMTVHKAKGLEADVVIILNCNSGKHGFPSELSDDPILNLLLSEADQFENGEERRLFYVAMTRAKESVYCIVDAAYKSKFIAELEVESGQSQNKKCPICKTADIVLRIEGTAKNGNTYKFYGCTNFSYGCDYTTTEWINNQ